MQQGATPAIKDDIIALSEDYHIITPYTSLLVLESDADRERFKVKRGFTMRDGEKFFAEGRDNANFELDPAADAAGRRLAARAADVRLAAALPAWAAIAARSSPAVPIAQSGARLGLSDDFFRSEEVADRWDGPISDSLILAGENDLCRRDVGCNSEAAVVHESWARDEDGRIDSLGDFAGKERFVESRRRRIVCRTRRQGISRFRRRVIEKASRIFRRCGGENQGIAAGRRRRCRCQSFRHRWRPDRVCKCRRFTEAQWQPVGILQAFMGL